MRLEGRFRRSRKPIRVFRTCCNDLVMSSYRERTEGTPPDLTGWTKKLAQVDQVHSLCLLGSHARGDAVQSSDVDVLVLLDGGDVPGSVLKSRLSGNTDALSLMVQSRARFESLARDGALFALHVRAEGRIRYDRDRWLERLLADTRDVQPDPSWTLNWAHQQLWAYDDLSRFNGIHLFALSRLYSLGRAIGIAMTVADGAPLFGKDEVFQAVALRRPWLGDEARQIARLRPFRERTEGRQVEDLPFDYHRAEDEVDDAVTAVRALLADEQ